MIKGTEMDGDVGMLFLLCVIVCVTSTWLFLTESRFLDWLKMPVWQGQRSRLLQAWTSDEILSKRWVYVIEIIACGTPHVWASVEKYFSCK